MVALRGGPLGTGGAMAAALEQIGRHAIAGPPAERPLPQRLDGAGRLMAEDVRQRRAIGHAVLHVDVGAADAAGARPHQHFAAARLRHGNIRDRQRRTERGQKCRLHLALSSPAAHNRKPLALFSTICSYCEQCEHIANIRIPG